MRNVTRATTAANYLAIAIARANRALEGLRPHLEEQAEHVADASWRLRASMPTGRANKI